MPWLEPERATGRRPRTQTEPPASAEHDDRHHGVVAPAAAEAVTVPSDRVVTISVEAAANRSKRLAEFCAVVLAQGGTSVLHEGAG